MPISNASRPPLLALALQTLPLTALPALSALPAPSAIAQEAVPAKEKPDAGAAVQKVEVSGVADRYDARREDTASKIVITAEEIQRHGDAVLSDVLKRQPGVTVSGASAGRGGGEIRMRGLGSGYTQVLLNGEPAPPGFSIDSLSPDLVERIEIIRAATAEFSTQAIAGTINIVLKKTVKAAQREVKQAISGAGSFIASVTTLQLSDKEGALSWSVTGNLNINHFRQTIRIDEEWSDAAERLTALRHADRTGVGNNINLGLTPRLNWTLDNGDTLTWQSFLNMNRVRREGAGRWTSLTGSLPYYVRDHLRVEGGQDNLRSDMNWVHRIEGGAKLDTKIGVQTNRRNNDYRQDAYDAQDALVRDSWQPGTSRENNVNTVGKFSRPLWENHALTLGWDLNAAQRHETRGQHDKAFPGTPATEIDEAFDARLTRSAVFAQNEWNVTPKWSLYLGARWEGLQTRSEGNGYQPVTNRASVFSPLFQTLWKLPDTQDDQVRFALTRTYKAPALERLLPRRNVSANNSPLSPDFMGNPHLRPELATGVDLAYEHYFSAKGAIMSASAYARRIDDFMRRDVVLRDGRWVSTPVNDGRARTHGLELEAKFPLQLFFPAAPTLDVRMNLARNWSFVDDVPGPNNRLADQTPLSANLGLDYKPDAAWSMGGTFSFKTGGPIRLSANSSTYANVTRELDFYALWKLVPGMQLRLSANNMLAQSFYNTDAYRDSRGATRSTTEYPVTPLLRAQLELRF